MHSFFLQKNSVEGCGGLGEESPGAFPKRGANFPAAIFLAGKCPNLGRDSISCCGKIGEEFSSSVGMCRKPQCSFVYPYPSVSALAGGNSDHGPSFNSDQNLDHPRLCIYWEKEKLRPWSEFLGRENSDHGLSFGCFWGRGRRGGSQDPFQQGQPRPSRLGLCRFQDLSLQSSGDAKGSTDPWAVITAAHLNVSLLLQKEAVK